MKIEFGAEYKIIATDPLFSDFFGLTAICKRTSPSGLFEMHVNEAYIFCNENQIRKVWHRKNNKVIENKNEIARPSDIAKPTKRAKPSPRKTLQQHQRRLTARCDR